ncbi:myosin-1-like isoform X5 [Camelus ferus]|uniref:Myosin-1-like isoform X5 n=1 Tax=Camelus ferus TaxID=419612 RepID=A0A8B8S9G7_CAMFR|nr:myosin-1-like isoform X5 [Camelus ferus]
MTVSFRRAAGAQEMPPEERAPCPAPPAAPRAVPAARTCRWSACAPARPPPHPGVPAPSPGRRRRRRPRRRRRRKSPTFPATSGLRAVRLEEVSGGALAGAGLLGCRLSSGVFQNLRRSRCPCKSEIHTPGEQTLKGQRTRLPGRAQVLSRSGQDRRSCVPDLLLARLRSLWGPPSCARGPLSV